MNDLVTPADLVEFGTFSDTMVDAAAAAVRREADWHIAPRRTETIALVSRRGAADELPLPTRSFSDAPVEVLSVTNADGASIAGWDQADGVLLLSRHWRARGRLLVRLTHGFVACPPDLLPVLAQRATSAAAPRDSRVSSFSNGTVQMAFRDARELDPIIGRYAVIGGVA